MLFFYAHQSQWDRGQLPIITSAWYLIICSRNRRYDLQLYYSVEHPNVKSGLGTCRALVRNCGLKNKMYNSNRCSRLVITFVEGALNLCECICASSTHNLVLVLCHICCTPGIGCNFSAANHSIFLKHVTKLVT